MSSSVSDDLPEPPVPVMPRTGTCRFPAAWRSSLRVAAGVLPASRAVSTRARLFGLAGEQTVERAGQVRGEIAIALADQLVDHLRQTEALAV